MTIFTPLPLREGMCWALFNLNGVIVWIDDRVDQSALIELMDESDKAMVHIKVVSR